jgi:peroxiredoxin
LTPEQRRDTRILAVAVDGVDDLRRMAERIAPDGSARDIVFLSDPGHRVIDRYGLFNAAYRRPVPHPTTFVLDTEGIVRWKFVEENYKVRPTNEQVRAALEAVRQGTELGRR